MTLSAQDFFWILCETGLTVESGVPKLHRMTAPNKLDKAF